MRMGVGLVRLAVGRPARMADPDGPRERRFRELHFEIAELALGAAALEPAVFQRGDAGGIVSPVFQPLQRFDDLRRDGRLTEDSDDSAHSSTNPSVEMQCLSLPMLRQDCGRLKSTRMTDCDTISSLGLRRFAARSDCGRRWPSRPSRPGARAPPQGIVGDVLGDHRAGADIGALADRHRARRAKSSTRRRPPPR